MSEMIERVAKAICGGEGSWHIYVPEARAAIEAMREPTEAMKAVFSSARPESPRTVWHETIDAALKG